MTAAEHSKMKCALCNFETEDGTIFVAHSCSGVNKDLRSALAEVKAREARMEEALRLVIQIAEEAPEGRVDKKSAKECDTALCSIVYASRDALTEGGEMMDLNPGKKDVPDPEMLGGELASPEEHLLEAIQRKEMSKWEKMVEIVTKSLPGNSEKRAIDAVLRAIIAAGYVVVKIPNSMTPVWIALHTGHSWDEEYIARNTPLMRDFLKELLAAGEVKPAKEAK